MVAPGVGEGFSSTGKGGFQQFEVNETMMRSLKKTDDLRTANNPKLSYMTPVVPGQQFIGKSMKDPIQLRVDIENIAGATLSSKHLTDGVKRLMVMHDAILKRRQL